MKKSPFVNNKRISLSPFILAFVLINTACNSTYKSGIKSFEKAEYQKAISFFEQALKEGSNPSATNAYIAEAYRQSNRINEAEKYYQTALQANNNDEKIKFYYAQSLKSNGKFDEAQAQFKQYLQNGTNAELTKRAKAETQNADKIKEIQNAKTPYIVSACGNLNTEADEFAPSFFKGKLLFSSTRKEVVYEGTGGRTAGIYSTDDKEIENPSPSVEVFNTNLYLATANEASPTFAPDGSYVVFARSSSGKKGESNEVDLYIARRTGNDWSIPEILPYPLNINKNLADAGNAELKGSQENVWTSCPFIRGDGKRLYFASNRKGGYGGIDIWIADISGGRFTNIRNAGKDVNTAGDEMFPFVSDEGILYFASNGHAGLGGLDIMEAVLDKGSIKIKNMGVPLNSPQDDFGFIATTDTTGYFSSNRIGGKGGDDIYKWTEKIDRQKRVNYFLGVEVVSIDPTDKTKKETPLANAKVEHYLGNIAKKDEKLQSLTTDAQGKIAPFPIKLQSNYVFDVNGGEDFFHKAEEYSTFGKAIPHELLVKPVTDTTFYTKIILEKIVITDTVAYQLEINFDFNKANIRPESAIELDKFVMFLQDNPQINIELSSHTDAVGSDASNLALSQRRADSTVAYLVKKGIEAKRMTSVGYGERKLKINTQQAEIRNRRTEFKVTRITRKRDED